MEHLGGSIAVFRREARLTQSQLAEKIGVSSAAVSKWESGRCLPELSLLPALCRALGTTPTRLLGFAAEPDQKELAQIAHQCKEALEHLPYEEGEALCRKFLQSYPGSMAVRLQVGATMGAFLDRIPDEEGIKAALCRAAELLEPVAACEDVTLREAAISQLSGYYLVMGQPDKAQKLAQRLVRQAVSPDLVQGNIYLSAGDDPAAQKAYEGALYTGLGQMEQALAGLCSLRQRQHSWAQAEQLAQLSLQLAGTMGVEELYAPSALLYLVLLRASQKDAAGTLEALGRLADQLTGSLDPAAAQKAAWFSTVTLSPVRTKAALRENLLRLVTEDARLDFLRGSREYENLLEKLMFQW